MIGHIPSILYSDFWIDSVATFDFFDLGVWLDVDGSCGYALPPGRMRNWYIYPGISYLLRVYYPSAPYMILVLYHTYGVPSDDAQYGGDYSTV